MNTAEADVEVDDPSAWAGCEQASSTFKSSNIHLPEFIAKVHELSVDPNLHASLLINRENAIDISDQVLKKQSIGHRAWRVYHM
ncbi:hypothetical protein Tco_0294315 [Tanacetum coccineum]